MLLRARPGCLNTLAKAPRTAGGAPLNGPTGVTGPTGATGPTVTSILQLSDRCGVVLPSALNLSMVRSQPSVLQHDSGSFGADLFLQDAGWQR